MRTPLLLLTVLAGGCGSFAWGGVRTYHPLTVAGTASRYAVFESAERAVRALSPSRIDLSEAPHRIVAFLDERATTRDRIVVDVSDQAEVTIQFHTEMWDADQWIFENFVCEDYANARERALADRILGAVLPATAVAWND